MRHLLLAAALGVAAAGIPAAPALAGGRCHAPDPTAGSGTEVELGKNCMFPSTLHASGETVTFVNRDPVVHNVAGMGWGVDELAPGATFTHAFDEPGTYPYSCTLHPGMVGAIEVGDAVPVVAVEEAAASSSSGSAAVVAAAVFSALGLGVGLAMRRRRPA